MKTKYEVARQHLGDRLYQEGETRELDANEAKRLVDLGVLVETKAEPKHENKARKGAPENK
jgi:hypothetical protein